MPKQLRKKLDEVSKLKIELNKKLKEIGQLNSMFSLGLVAHLMSAYTEKDWKNYEKETKNKKPIIDKAVEMNPVEKLINSRTGFGPEIDERNLKFIIWCVNGFMDGVNGS